MRPESTFLPGEAVVQPCFDWYLSVMLSWILCARSYPFKEPRVRLLTKVRPDIVHSGVCDLTVLVRVQIYHPAFGYDGNHW